MFRLRTFSGFTLIELLVTVGILSIVSTVIVVIINPAELLRQTRDANRLADITSIHKALGLLLVDNPNASMGMASTVYISIPDTSPSCANLGLPALPSGYTYGCVASSTFRNVDGTGWIPVDFRSFSSGSPLATLPVDAVNATSSGLYYTYTTGGSWSMGALLESNKYLEEARADGGKDPLSYEMGSDLALAPFSHGLVAYWPFDEDSGITSANAIAGGKNVTWSSASMHSTGKIGNGISLTSGGTVYGDIPSFPGTAFKDFSAEFWMKSSSSTSSGISLLFGWDQFGGWSNTFRIYKGSVITFNVRDTAVLNDPIVSTNTTFTDGLWHHIVAVRSGINLYIYVDGALNNSATTGATGSNTFGPTAVGIGGRSSTEVTADIDELRVYSRALSSGEITALYNATK